MRSDAAGKSSRFARAVERIDHLREGGNDDTLIPLGYTSIDAMLGGGVHHGDLISLGGDTGSGTSSLLMGIAIRSAAALAARDAAIAHTADEVPVSVPRVLLLTSELTADRAHQRVLGIAAHMSTELMRSGDVDDISRARLAAAAVDLRDHGPHIERIDSGLAGVIAQLDRWHSVRLVLIDGLEALLDTSTITRSTRDDALADLVLALKRLALARNIAIVVVTHFTGGAFDRHDKRPRITDFGARGAPGIHTDVILGLFREEIYERDLGIAGAAEVILLKHREMPTAYSDLYFQADSLVFEEIE